MNIFSIPLIGTYKCHSTFIKTSPKANCYRISSKSFGKLLHEACHSLEKIFFDRSRFDKLNNTNLVISDKASIFYNDNLNHCDDEGHLIKDTVIIKDDHVFAISDEKDSGNGVVFQARKESNAFITTGRMFCTTVTLNDNHYSKYCEYIGDIENTFYLFEDNSINFEIKGTKHKINTIDFLNSIIYLYKNYQKHYNICESWSGEIFVAQYVPDAIIKKIW